MNRGDAELLVSNRLGRVSSLATSIPVEMQISQTQLERDEPLPWFLQSEAALTTTVGNRDVLLPTGFIRETEDPHPLWYLPSDGSALCPLPKVWYDVGVRKYGVQEGSPKWYALVGDRFKIFPIPDAVYNLYSYFYKKGEVLSDTSSENVWLDEAPNLLVASTVIRMGSYTQNPAAIQLAQGDLAAERERIWRANETRENASLIHQMRVS